MEVHALAKYVKMSPKKIRMVSALLKDAPVDVARAQLAATTRAAARPLSVLLQSAVANAKENHRLTKDQLVVKTVQVDDGPTTYRWMPRAFGRAAPIRRRTAHIKIVLEAKEEQDRKVLGKSKR